MRLSLEKKVIASFALAVALLSAIEVVSHLSVARMRADTTRVRHSQETIAHLGLLLDAVTDVEASQHGYTITGDEDLVAPYEDAVRTVDADLQRLRELTADDLLQRGRFEALARLVGERMAVSRANLALRRSQGFAMPRGEIATGRGRQLHDRLRSLVVQMEEAEQVSMGEWESRVHQSATVTHAVIIGGSVFTFGFVGFALWVIGQDFAGRRRADVALREAHDQLEARVRERTAELVQSNESLHASEERFRLLVAGVEDYAIIMLDPAGIVVSWNEGAERIKGWGAEEIIGQHLSRFYPAEDVAAGKPSHQLEVATAAGHLEEEGWRVRKDGSRFWANVVITVLREEAGGLRGFAKVTCDMTGRRLAEQTLQENERRLAGIIGSAMDAIITVDEQQRITLFNAAAESMFRYTNAEVLGQPLERFIPERFRAAHAGHIRGFGQTHETRRAMGNLGAVYGLRANGEEFPIEASISHIDVGGHTLYTVILRDISERQQAEAKATAQLARLALLQQITRAIGERQDLSSIFQVVIRSLEDHLTLDFSCVCLYDPVAHALTVTRVGLRSEALATELAISEHARIAIDASGLSACLRGQLVYEPDTTQRSMPFPQRLAASGLRSLVMAPLVVESMESQVFGVLVAARRQPHSFSSGECEFLQQLGEHVALAVHQLQLYDALQQAYHDLRHTQQAVLRQERLRALGEMASGIAHDINNAISPVSLYTEVLLETEPQLSDRARHYLETIHRAIDDVAVTVARMREFYRQREPQITLMPVDINDLVQQVVDLTRARWSDIPQQQGQVIEVHTELAPDLPAVMGVDSEVREALTNLVFNAVDAMPNGGTLTLRSTVTAGMHIAAQVPALRYVSLEVVDTGVGMDEDTRRRCLEPFFTTKGERGTGLGLAMVYGVARRHNAEIDIESAVGTGTTVRLSFPVPTAVVTPAQPATAYVVPSRLHLLIIDDDPLLIKSLRDVLEGDGHIVVVANGGQEGIEAFRKAQQQHELFDAVMTDLGMPYVDGRKVASAVKAASPDTPVIMLTGWGQRLVTEGDVPAHVDYVLSKPPKLHDLREALAQCSRPTRS
jgi:PAS domain S-box-containing protein